MGLDVDVQHTQWSVEDHGLVGKSTGNINIINMVLNATYTNIQVGLLKILMRPLSHKTSKHMCHLTREENAPMG